MIGLVSADVPRTRTEEDYEKNIQYDPSLQEERDRIIIK